MPARPRIDIEAVKAAHPIDEVVGRSVALRRRGAELVGLCPFHDEKTPSFYVVPRKRLFHCFGCGASGDAIDFVKRLNGCDLPRAVELITGGVAPDPALAARDRERARAREEADRARRARMLEAARRVWTGAAPSIDGTPAETYLARRGLVRPRGGWPATLRYAPALAWRDEEYDPMLRRGHAMHGRRFPALVALFTLYARDGAKSFGGVHRIYLAPDGRGRAPVPKSQQKKMLAPQPGAAIWFASPVVPKPRSRIWTAEGIETALSCRQVRPRRLWCAAGSIDRMGQIALPEAVREVTLAMDNDMKDPGLAAAKIARARQLYAARDVAVSFVTAAAGADFNDMLQAGAAGRAA